MTECGKPAHLYPETPADQAAFVAGPDSEAFWRAAMIARCDAHAPDGPTAAYFSAQIVPCGSGDPA